MFWIKKKAMGNKLQNMHHNSVILFVSNILFLIKIDIDKKILCDFSQWM